MFPERSAARSDALQTRGPGAACVDPGSAPHRSAALHAAAHPGNSLAPPCAPCGSRLFGTARARSLRLAAQDVALSRRKQGFESPRERQRFIRSGATHHLTSARSLSGDPISCLTVRRHGGRGLRAGGDAPLPCLEIGEAGSAVDKRGAHRDDRIKRDVGNGELSGKIGAAASGVTLLRNGMSFTKDRVPPRRDARRFRPWSRELPPVEVAQARNAR